MDRRISSKTSVVVAVIAAFLAVLWAPATGAATSGDITDFPVPTRSSRPEAITAGPDGNVWFTQSGSGNGIGRITPAGKITEYAVADPSWGNRHGIAAGPDGNLWFTQPYGRSIGRITPSGVITEFLAPTAGGLPEAITAGPDGNLWFTEPGMNRIGRISPTATPTAVKKTCTIDVVGHKPIPKTVGNRILTDTITTTSACVLPKPVVLCRPLASTAAGEQAFCTTKATRRGTIRVKTLGYEAVLVTAIVRAKPKPANADTWRPNTWRKTWVLK
jgi:streptogramin lyase